MCWLQKNKTIYVAMYGNKNLLKLSGNVHFCIVTIPGGIMKLHCGITCATYLNFTTNLIKTQLKDDKNYDRMSSWF